MKKISPLLLVLLAICLTLTACAGVTGDGGNTDNAAAHLDAQPVTPDNTADAPAVTDTPAPVPEPVPAAKSFTIYPPLLQLPLGQHVTLDAINVPDGKSLIWESSETSVAAVDENGRISPAAEGETIITATVADDVSVAASCGVRVTADGNIFLWE